jgi:hypothetical protein
VTDGLNTLLGEASASSFEAVLLIVLLSMVVLIVVYAIRTGVPPQSSGRAEREALLHLLPDRIEGPIIDLGSGWGALTEALADRYPDNPVIGFELSPIPYWVARLRLRMRPRANVTYHRADFLRQDLSAAGAVACFLMIGAMRPLAVKLGELRPGTVVVSNAFALPDWTPDEVITLSTTGGTMYYRYIAGASPRGSRTG